MKKTSVLIFVMLISAMAFSQADEVTSKKDQIDVYYFHRTDRCATCMSIEENTKTVLEQYFSEEVKEGKISFKSINFEGEEDKELIEKFKADGPSLFLIKFKNGKEKTKNLTDLALENSLHSADVFQIGLRDKINELLR